MSLCYKPITTHSSLFTVTKNSSKPFEILYQFEVHASDYIVETSFLLCSIRLPTLPIEYQHGSHVKPTVGSNNYGQSPGQGKGDCTVVLNHWANINDWYSVLSHVNQLIMGIQLSGPQDIHSKLDVSHQPKSFQ